MTDIVKRLHDKVPMIWGDEGFMITDDDTVLATFKEAADEIERLREALERLAELDGFVCGRPMLGQEVINYTQFVARAALGEKE